MYLSGTNIGKLLLRIGFGFFFITLGLEIFSNPAYIDFVKTINLGFSNQMLSMILANGFVILGSFLVFGFLTSYSALVLLFLFLIKNGFQNLTREEILILFSLGSLIFLGSGRYGLDYLFKRNSKTLYEKEYENFEHKKSQKPAEISKPHIEHKKQKVQVITKTKSSDDDDGKTIIEI